ncbi:MAG: hypothetical protein AAGA37_08505 [Actinomycetota bacterium]
MISFSLRRTLFSPESELARVAGLTIPSWDAIPAADLLRAVDYYDDAVFNRYQLDALVAEIHHWLAYEADRGDPEGRREKILELEPVLRGRSRSGGYAVFLGE